MKVEVHLHQGCKGDFKRGEIYISDKNIIFCTSNNTEDNLFDGYVLKSHKYEIGYFSNNWVKSYFRKLMKDEKIIITGED